MTWATDKRGLNYCPECRVEYEDLVQDRAVSSFIKYTCIVCGEELHPDGVELDPEMFAGQTVTYGEIRWWIRQMGLFTISDIAETIGISFSLAERFVGAAEWHSIIKDTGARTNGGYVPEEPLWEYIPPPPGPRNHPVGLVEWLDKSIGCYLDAPVRGLPIRIRTDKDNRRAGSMPGTGHKMRQAQARWEKMQEAAMKRKDEQKSKAQKQPKWKRQK